MTALLPVVTETVMVPAALAAAVSKFSPREVHDLARRRPTVVRAEWRGEVLYVNLADVLDLSDMSVPIEYEAFDEDEL
jgi:hypothetical protein